MSMSKEKVIRLFNECMNELYMNSTPSITWNEIKEQYKDSDRRFWEEHYLNESRYDEIVESYRKKIPKMYHFDLDFFLLNYSPTSVKK